MSYGRGDSVCNVKMRDDWWKSEEGMRAEIDRRIAEALFPYILADEIEDAIDDELILQGREP